jgi:phosphoglycolate phosphatase
VLQEYLANYARTPADKTLFYPHVREDLAALRHAGLRLGICTNKPQELAFRILGILGIADLFDTVVGADAVPASKPDPAHLMAVARRMELNGQPWAYIGDTQVDKATAAAVGVPFYAVPWGTGRNLDVEPCMRLTRLRDLDGAKAIGRGN